MNEPKKGTAIFAEAQAKHHPCEIFNCSNRRQWVICSQDNPDHRHVGSFEVCTQCAENLISNLPVNLIAGAQDIEARISQEYSDKLLAMETFYEDKLQTMETFYEKDALLKAAQKVEVTPLPFDLPELDEKPTVNGGIFRCLDCSKEFDTKKALSMHMRIHVVK
jgi:hypothetical protein